MRMDRHITKSKPRTSWITLAVLCLATAGVLLFLGRDALSEVYDQWKSGTRNGGQPLPIAVSLTDLKNNANKNSQTSTTEAIEDKNTQTQEPETLPTEFLLQVPFTTQAPYANWDMPYQEACEEASALTVHYFYEGKTFTQSVADKEILDLVDFENSYLGFYKDTTAEELSRVIKAYWKYDRVDVIDNPSIDDIKRHVFEGRPVIVPAAGKLLGNPNFRNGGPLYHNFVIRGWTKTQFITNDVGTRKGENYRYDYQTVMDAMHDWNGGNVTSGAKRIVVIYPNES